jgi:hypothetical protein
MRTHLIAYFTGSLGRDGGQLRVTPAR